MIIQCTACSTRFLLDDAKVTGKGVRVKCRKCGTSFTVMREEGVAAPEPAPEKEKFLDLGAVLRESATRPLPGPDAPPAASPAEAPEPAPAAPPAPEAPEPAPAAPPAPTEAGVTEEAIDFETIFAAAARSAGGVTPAPSREGPPPSVAAPGAPLRVEEKSPDFVMSTADSLDFIKELRDKAKGEAKGPEETRMELDVSGTLRDAPPVDVEEARRRLAAPPPETYPRPAPAFPEPPADEAVPPPGSPRREVLPPPPGPEIRAGGAARGAARPRGAPLQRRHASRIARPSAVLLVLVLGVLAGGGIYFGLTKTGRDSVRDLMPWVDSIVPGLGILETRFVMGNVVGLYEADAAAGTLFVVRGEVTNSGRTNRNGASLRVILLDAQNRTLAERTAYAGNVLPADTLRAASREKIAASMGNRVGEGFSNVDIPPGKSVPFMVVFFDVPEGIEAYRVEAKDVE